MPALLLLAFNRHTCKNVMYVFQYYVMILAVWNRADYLFTPTLRNVHNLFEGGYTFSITLEIGIVNVIIYYRFIIFKPPLNYVL